MNVLKRALIVLAAVCMLSGQTVAYAGDMQTDSSVEEKAQLKENEESSGLKEESSLPPESAPVPESEKTSDSTNTGGTDNDIQYNSSDTDNSRENAPGYSLKLNGICLIERGNKCDVGAAYESNDPNVEFQWLQYDLSKDKWTEVAGWQKGNWITWNLEKAGDYWIYVNARTSDGAETNCVYGYRYKGIQTTLNGICVIDQGTKYDMGIAYESNDSGIKFQWKIYELSKKKWSVLQKPSSGNWVSWEPEDEGSYWIHVEAIESTGDIKTYTIPFYFSGLVTTLNGICTIERDNQVDVGIAYNTNDSQVKFRWKIYNLKTGKWADLTDWSSGNWASWKPEGSGDYWIYAEAKGRNGSTVSQVIGYHVNSAKILNLAASPESPNWVGSTIQLNGRYRDVSGEVSSDRYLLYNGQNWRELEKNDKGAVWNTDALGTYLLCYEIYDAEGRLIDQFFKGYSIEIPYVNLNGIYIRNDGNLNIAMAVNSNTNDKEIQYRWQYYDLSTQQWGLICDWNSLNAASWQASKTGTYWLHVEAKLHDGTIKSQTTGYTLRRYQNPGGYYQIQDSISLSGGGYNLFYGCEGLKVMYVMRKLGVGYGIGMGGAFYGNNVILAVKAFQQRAGLPVTGYVDYATWTAIGLSEYDWYNLGAYVSPMRINTDSTREDCIEAMISTAYSYLGTPYVIGASGAPGTGIDCSGLVMQALFSAGIDTSPINPIRHSQPGYEYESRNMWASPLFKHVSYGERQRGDLIFYQGSGGSVIHVAIYLGNDMVIESWPNQVVVWPIRNSSRSNIKGVARPFV